MTRHFDVLGYEDEAGNWIELGSADRDALSAGDFDDVLDLDDTYGMFVHVWDDEDEEFDQFFWTFTYGPFEDWEDWWDYIDAMMEAHGMAA